MIQVKMRGSPFLNPPMFTASTGSNGLYLKPEEIKLGMVSQPQVVKVCTKRVVNTWSKFVAQELIALLAKIKDDNAGKSSQNQYRMVMCPSGEPEVFEQDLEDQMDDVSLPMKVKLISNVSLEASRAQREEGCLVRLARAFGPQNLEIIIDGMKVMGENRVDWPKLRLSWNEDDLCWEADCQAELTRKELEMFGKEGWLLEMFVGGVNLALTNSGVHWMLQRMYGKLDNLQYLQRKCLERGKYADMEIISKGTGTGSGQIRIKCHRKDLAVASPVFDKMLEDDEENDGNGKWKEAKSRTVTLPESEEAIRAMLHFIYYGGCDRIFRNRVDVILELLEAGEKYQIPGLVEVASFVLLTDAKEYNWFTADAAVHLFGYARHLKGNTWDKLRARSFEILEYLDQDQRKASVQYQKLLQIVVKLGPTFANMLQGKYEPPMPSSLPNGRENVTEAEAALTYDLVSLSYDFKRPRNLFVALEIIMLAEFCGKPPPEFANAQLAEKFLQDKNVNDYRVDYLVELFCYSRKKSGSCWESLKSRAAGLLEKMWMEQPKKIRDSKQYSAMRKKDPEAFEELISLRKKKSDAKSRKRRKM